MERRFLHQEKKTALIMGIFYLVGIVSHAFNLTRGWMLILTPWVLLGAGAVAVIPYLREKNLRWLVWFVLTWLVTFGLEVLGVHTGMVFGAYQYGPTLGFHIAGVPPIIGFNWVLIIFGISILLNRWIKHPLPAALLTGVAATAFDWIMEPVAIGLDYWTWSGGSIPLQNYLAWFIIGTLFSLVFFLLRIRTDKYLASWYVGIQLLFFLVLRVYVEIGLF